MATQFLIPVTAIVNTHMTVSIDTELSSCSGCFDVKIEVFGMEIPMTLVDLFNIEVNKHGGGNGSINRRVYSSDIKSFLDSFEELCYDNLTSKVQNGTKQVYYYVPNVPLGLFAYSSYQQDELTIQFQKDEIIFYLDGKEIPDVYHEIHKGFEKNNIEFNLRNSNERIVRYSIDKGYFEIKALVQSIVSYLGINEYQIVNIEEGQYCIDLRNDGSKDEVISIDNYTQFVNTIDFANEPELTLGDLFDSMVGIATALLPDESEAIDVQSIMVS
jgi:hypothetical protein